MQLTQFTDYSLRLLLFLTEHPDRLCTIGEIAEWYGISKEHLVKVSHHLCKQGYIRSVQGKGGGIGLNRLPEEMNLGEVVRDTEPNFHTVECFDRERNRCRITARCKLKGVLHEATYRFFSVLDQYTLRDLSSGQPQINSKGKT